MHLTNLVIPLTRTATMTVAPFGPPGILMKLRPPSRPRVAAFAKGRCSAYGTSAETCAFSSVIYPAGPVLRCDGGSCTLLYRTCTMRVPVVSRRLWGHCATSPPLIHYAATMATLLMASRLIFPQVLPLASDGGRGCRAVDGLYGSEDSGETSFAWQRKDACASPHMSCDPHNPSDQMHTCGSG